MLQIRAGKNLDTNSSAASKFLLAVQIPVSAQLELPLRRASVTGVGGSGFPKPTLKALILVYFESTPVAWFPASSETFQ
jgi:hypothetical protein